MKKQLKILLTLGLLTLFFIMSCEKQDNSLKKSTTNYSDNNNFVPSKNVAFKHGMLHFKDKEAMEITLFEILAHKRETVDLWENKIGFVSQQFMFNEVVREEDAISHYYETLPHDEQERYKQMPEVHSGLYDKYLREGVIKIITDKEDNSTYFDYAVVDPGMASIINKDGFVKVGNLIYQYTNVSLKIILDGDYKKMNLLRNITNNHQDEYIIVIKYNTSNGAYRTLSEEYSYFNNWLYPSGRKRIKLWLDGHSESIDDLSSNCSQYLNCTYTLRSQAQKKNFWGNWKYQSNFGPSLHIDDANWTYNYGRYMNDNCSGSLATFAHVEPYTCTGCSSCLCPTPPHDVFYAWTNNGYFNLSPHGIWNAEEIFLSDIFSGYFSHPFSLSYRIPAYYYTHSYLLEN